MPELVACPSCGCKVQVGELLLGRKTRCIACGNQFVASEAVPAVPGVPSLPLWPKGEPTPSAPSRPRRPDDPDPYPVAPVDPEPAARREDGSQRGPARHRLPLCPRCHRPVEWDAPSCVHCFHLLEREDRDDPLTWRRRRDGEDHRGGLIEALGTISLLCGVLGLCTAGVGALAALITGILAVSMASSDLERMRRGELDPDGAAATQAGRNKAIAGIVLAVVFGAVAVLLGMDYYFDFFS